MLCSCNILAARLIELGWQLGLQLAQVCAHPDRALAWWCEHGKVSPFLSASGWIIHTLIHTIYYYMLVGVVFECCSAPLSINWEHPCLAQLGVGPVVMVLR